MFPAVFLWNHIWEHNRRPYTDESLSKQFQGMKIILMSWCNGRQWNMLNKKIPILMLVHKNFTLDALMKVKQLIAEGRQVRTQRRTQHENTNQWRRMDLLIQERFQNWGLKKKDRGARSWQGWVPLPTLVRLLFLPLQWQLARGAQQTKAHGGWCRFLTALVQLQWVCHIKLGGDRKLAPL